MKKIINFLYSTRLMAVLFIVFAISMGVATFIENDFGTQTAKKLVYNAWWFELIMVFFVINFFGNIFRYKLYRKEKWSVLLFHLAFLFIIIGAGITRYIGFEGMMVLDEGESSNKFLSETTYLNVIVDNGKFQKTTANKLLLSAWGKNSKSFTETFQPEKNKKEHLIKFNLVDYIPWAEQKFIEDSSRPKHLLLVESSSGNRHEHYIKQGTIQNIHNVLVGFDAPGNNASINIKSASEGLMLFTKQDGNFMIMASQKKGLVHKDSIQKFNLRSLYNIYGLPFVVPKPPVGGDLKIVRGEKDEKKYDTVIFDISTGGQTKRINFTGGQFNTGGKKEFSMGELNFRAWYGAKQKWLPFSVKLNDFQLEKYPGSESASSFASEVTVINKDETFDYRIFMNHILNYKGYRFFQSSYKNAGEAIEQSHLSVNHDYWGTLTTYLGYFLLYFGLIASLFVKNTRFYALKKTLAKIRKKRATLLILLFFSFLGNGYAQHSSSHFSKISERQIDSILKANLVDNKHADLFSQLVIQDVGGRMKPAHTFASELVRKVSHTNEFKGMSPSQILLSMTENSRFWFEVPFIYLERGNSKIREELGLPVSAKYARFSDFITPTGAYKIKEQVANAQKARIKSLFEKDLIKVDKRIGLMYSALSGSILKIYPVPNHENNKWVSHPEVKMAGFKGIDSTMVPRLLPTYLQSLQSAKKTGDYSKVNQVLDGIKNFQRKYGSSVIPSEKKINLEITYNKLKIFILSSYFYALFGVFLIFFVILGVFYSKSKFIGYATKILISFIVFTFLFHTFGLLARWYISGNAPWSNAYESIIYVAWATIFFGLFLGRKSALTIGATTFLTSIILAFAHQNWLDPEIANLQPVLNSWWLMVHVSVIVASYGPFSLSMILGILSLLLTLLTTQKNKKKMDVNIKELTIINEMSLNVGLVLLTIGNFLGGMWANESWGRYWGWDPKETWALISIMIYAFVLHMRLVPKLRGRLAFNFASAFAYLSIMMTYFGVNFYLSGLHSYASGDKAVTPREAYIYTGFLVLLTIGAWFKHRKFYTK